MRPRPSARTAPTPPGAGVPSRAHHERTIIGPAHRDQPAPSASTSKTVAGGAVDAAVTSYVATPSPSPECRLAPFDERADAVLRVLGCHDQLLRPGLVGERG